MAEEDGETEGEKRGGVPGGTGDTQEVGEVGEDGETGFVGVGFGLGVIPPCAVTAKITWPFFSLSAVLVCWFAPESSTKGAFLFFPLEVVFFPLPAPFGSAFSLSKEGTQNI